jgi:hypothetical protein
LQGNHSDDDRWTIADKLRSFCSESIAEFTARFATVIDSLTIDSQDPVVVDMYAAAGMLDWGLTALRKESIIDHSLIEFAAYMWDSNVEDVRRLSLDDVEDAVFAATSDVKALELGVRGFEGRLSADLAKAVSEYQLSNRDAVKSVDADDCLDPLLILRDTLEFAMMYLTARSVLNDLPISVDISMHKHAVRLADLKLRITFKELLKKFDHVDLPLASPETFWWRKPTNSYVQK